MSRGFEKEFKASSLGSSKRIVRGGYEFISGLMNGILIAAASRFGGEAGRGGIKKPLYMAGHKAR